MRTARRSNNHLPSATISDVGWNGLPSNVRRYTVSTLTPHARCHSHLIMLESRLMARHVILVNGNIVTLDEQMPRARAVVLRGDEIVYVGDDATASTFRQRDSTLIDLRGKLALPAFTDAHIHFTGFAQSLENVDLRDCRSQQEAVERVRARAAQTPPGQLIWGGGWNNAEWENPTCPDKHALDAVAPHHPVILTRQDGHSVWVNSLALQNARITRDTRAPDGGVIDRDARGEPTGILRENAIDLLGGGIGAFGNAIRQDTLQRAIMHAHSRALPPFTTSKAPMRCA